MKLHITAASILMLAALSLTPAAAQTAWVHVQGFAFTPQTITISPGDTVSWDNLDNTTHTLTDLTCARAGGSGTPCVLNDELPAGATRSQTFTAIGVVRYKCVIHDIFGTIDIVDPNGPLPDLIITSITSAAASATTTRLTIAVSNPSTVGAPGSEVSIRYFDAKGWHTIGNALSNPIPAGTSQNVVQLWNTGTKIGDFGLEATADGLHQVAESNETNNVATARISFLVPPGTVSPGMDLTSP